jgi:predicted deacylase
VSHNGGGPTAPLMDCSDGDEYKGQTALSNLIRSLDGSRIKGRVIVLPMANVPGGLAGT